MNTRIQCISYLYINAWFIRKDEHVIMYSLAKIVPTAQTHHYGLSKKYFICRRHTVATNLPYVAPLPIEPVEKHSIIRQNDLSLLQHYLAQKQNKMAFVACNGCRTTPHTKFIRPYNVCDTCFLSGFY